jgi:hypothetical protein
MRGVEFLDLVLAVDVIFSFWEVLRNVNMHNNLVEFWDACKPPAATR